MNAARLEFAELRACGIAKRQRTEALGREITELCGYLNAGTCQLLAMIRQFDREGLWHQDGICSCAHWLNWKCGIGMNAAREKVRVANALGALPKISQAFAAGEISYSKVRAMTRIATPDNEDYLLTIARHGTAYHVETLVRKYRYAKKLQDLDEANDQHRERTVQVNYEHDGSITLRARLPAEKGAIVVQALEAAAARQDAANGRDDDAGPVAGETVTNIAAATRSDKPAFGQRRADALAEMAEHYLNIGPAASSTADRYQVVLHVSAETLTADDGDLSHLENGPRVSAETSRRLCCDASLRLLHRDAEGSTLNIGRKSRVIPPAMRRALKARDEQCRFPGCTQRFFIDGHHIRHWSAGGETRLDNLVQLCRHHHRLVHEGGFSCSRNADGAMEFRNPGGELLPRAGRMPGLPADVDLGERLRTRDADLYIDANTCVSNFTDTRIDWNLAVGALFQ